MATKKIPGKSTRKPITSKIQPQFVVLWDQGSRDHYWSDSGHGFTTSLNEATRFTKENGIRKLGELLHEDKIVCELLDVSAPYVSPVKIGTVVLRDGVAEMVNSVPLVRGGTLLLISPGDPREIRIQDFLEEINDGDLEVLWDPELRMIPDENHNYLEAHGFLKDNDEVGE
jgi:hypothetical protein